MKKSVKLLSLFTIALLFYGTLQSQTGILSGGGFIHDIKKVIEDFPNRFANIKGELILQNPQFADYACNFKVNGAEESTITFYSSDKKIICSWKALIISTDDFSEAKGKYKNIYNQLNNQSVNFNGPGSFKLKGDYAEPREEKKFSASVLSLHPVNDSVKKLRIEVLLQYEKLEWKLSVLVYDKEKEDHERGSIIDE